MGELQATTDLQEVHLAGRRVDGRQSTAEFARSTAELAKYVVQQNIQPSLSSHSTLKHTVPGESKTVAVVVMQDTDPWIEF